MTDNKTPHDASDYDEAVRQTIPFYELIETEAIDLVESARPDVGIWLDTGCGTGYLVERACARFPRTQFILVDPSSAMLEQARKRLAKGEGARIRFLPAIPSKDLIQYQGVIQPQVITAILCHHYLQILQRQEALQACYDLLVKGGLYITFENVAPLTEAGLPIGLDRWRRFQVSHGRTETVVTGHLRRYGTEYFPLSVEEHLKLLRLVGFSVVELFWYSRLQAGFYAIK